MSDRTLIEWGIGFLVIGLGGLFIQGIPNFIMIYVDITLEQLVFIFVVAILCGIASIIIGAMSRQKTGQIS